MAKRRKKGLCYYCDEKYSPKHKFKEPKFFQIDATDHSSSEEAPHLRNQRRKMRTTSHTMYLKNQLSRFMVSQPFLLPKLLKSEGLLNIAL